ncbi:hypothetical protein VOM14_29785 [Paraburkholderia sp. MPAMCS5]|uniref:hypothetical protein n=1 Tax=Paraburkholderia sp. MPAMCS5 TaxID=3112563 RepID=UPI002E16D5BD|nr:hypothetical protein [Paraburkholderia sp. MPAMCS5]
MTTLILKDLARVHELDAARSRSVRGGIACLKPVVPVPCHGGIVPPIIVRGGWNEEPLFHPGCGPTPMPWFGMPSPPERKIIPL